MKETLRNCNSQNSLPTLEAETTLQIPVLLSFISWQIGLISDGPDYDRGLAQILSNCVKII